MSQQQMNTFMMTLMTLIDRRRSVDQRRGLGHTNLSSSSNAKSIWGSEMSVWSKHIVVGPSALSALSCYCKDHRHVSEWTASALTVAASKDTPLQHNSSAY